MKEAIINSEKKKVGDFELSTEVFGESVNTALIYDALKMQLAGRRQGDAASKNRTLVSGSTKKIYRQKGTGRARHSDSRANIFVGGGKAFGPHPRDYTYSIPLKARRGALRAALSSKLHDGKLLIVDALSAKEPNTYVMATTLKTLGVVKGLIVTDTLDRNLELSVRNIPNIKLVRWDGLNVYDVLRHEHLVMTPAALTKVQETLKP